MKKLYEYQKGTIKLILDEEPMINNFMSKRKIEKIFSSFTKLNTPKLVGLEVVFFRGSRICYGMLATKVFHSNSLDSINVSIDYTEKNIVHYKDSILCYNQNVYKGLQKQYLEYIMNFIRNFIRNNSNFPAIDLIFEYAANCEVGSSPNFFEIITEMIMNIIHTSNHNDLFLMDAESFANLYAYEMKLGKNRE